MASTPRNTEAVTLRLDKQFVARAREEAKRLQMANLQELIRKLLEDLLAKREPNNITATSKESGIDLRDLLMEAHKALAEERRNVGELIKVNTKLSEALIQERKNAPAEPAAYEEPTGSTAEPPQRGRANVIKGLRQGSPV